MTRGGGLRAALLATLSTPATWPLALATFLIRGGIVVVILPIVVLPTTVGLGNTFGPTLLSVAFGSIPLDVIVVAASVGIGALVWIVAGGWLAAGLEAEGARIVAAHQEVAGVAGAAVAGRSVAGGSVATGAKASRPAPGAHAPVGRAASRILAVRLIAAVPFAIALGLGSVRLIFVTYRELTTPSDVATSIVVRVLRGAPEVVVAVLITWMLAEIVGAVAARRIALADTGTGSALAQGASIVLREPLSSLARFWLPTFVLFAVLVPSALAAASAWEGAGTALDDGADPLRLAAIVVLFVGLWVVGLLLIGIVCAWRAAVWTVAEVSRRGRSGGLPTDDRVTGGSAARLPR